MGQPHSTLNIDFYGIENEWKILLRSQDAGLDLFYKRIANTNKVVFFIIVSPCEDNCVGIKINVNNKFLPRNKLESYEILLCSGVYVYDKYSNDYVEYEFVISIVLNIPFPNGNMQFHKTKNCHEITIPLMNTCINSNCQKMATKANHDIILSGRDFLQSNQNFITRENQKKLDITLIYAQTHVLSYFSAFFRDLIKSIPFGTQISVDERSLILFDSSRLRPRVATICNPIVSLNLDFCSHKALYIIVEFLHVKKLSLHDIRDVPVDVWLEILKCSFQWQIHELQRPALLFCYLNISVNTAHTLLKYSLQLENALDINLLINDFFRVNWKNISDKNLR